jgi:hypothetical protein
MKAGTKHSKPSATARRANGSRRLRPRLLLLAASLVVAAIIAEGGLRLFFPDKFHIFQDERNAVFRYDPTLGWFPVPNSGARLVASRPITVVHNSQGFRAPEFVKDGKPRVAFLGDSFVWGYDVEAAERFTDKLQAKHPEWNVLNLGVSGYGTDQEYLLLQRYFDEYRPWVIFLVFSTETDPVDNSANVRYGGYYKPYYTLDNNRLVLHGVPVPRTEKVFLADHDLLARSYVVRLLARAWFGLAVPRPLYNTDPTGALILELQRYVQMKGAVLLVGLTDKNPELEEALKFLKIPYINLSTSLRYPGFGGHWTPEGHTFVCEKIEEFLVKGKYLGP